jgi:hypothetical protein
MVYHFPMTTQILYEATSLALALITGIFAYLYMNKSMRMLFFQLIFWILVYMLGYVITNYQKTNNMPMNNQWLFNLYIPIEFLMLTIAVYYFISDKLIRYFISASYVVFLLLVAYQISSSGSEKFIHYSMAIGGIIMTSLFILILYKKFSSDPESWKYSPEVWSSLGLIIYFACNVPFISSLSYLNEKSPETSKTLFHYVTDNLAIIRYGMLAIAFLLVRKNKSTRYSTT